MYREVMHDTRDPRHQHGCQRPENCLLPTRDRCKNGLERSRWRVESGVKRRVVEKV